MLIAWNPTLAKAWTFGGAGCICGNPKRCGPARASPPGCPNLGERMGRRTCSPSDVCVCPHHHRRARTRFCVWTVQYHRHGEGGRFRCQRQREEDPSMEMTAQMVDPARLDRGMPVGLCLINLRRALSLSDSGNCVCGFQKARRRRQWSKRGVAEVTLWSPASDDKSTRARTCRGWRARLEWCSRGRTTHSGALGCWTAGTGITLAEAFRKG